MKEKFGEQLAENDKKETPEANISEEQIGEGRNQEIKEKAEDFSRDKIKEYARNFFEEVYSAEKKPDSFKENFFAMEKTQHTLSVLANCEEEWEEKRIYSDNFREATTIFLEELMVFCEDKEDDEKIHEFLGVIREMFFSSSPNITSALNFKQNFDFAAKATRLKNLQAHIGGGINGEFAYKIGWGYNPDLKTDKLLEAYNESSVSEKLDKLNLMEILGAELIGAGNAYNYGDEKLVKLLNKIKQTNHNIFIDYYIGILEERLEHEYSEPSKGIVHYMNDPSDARLWERLTDEQMKQSKELQALIHSDRCFQRGEKIIQIADNVVAIFNHANVPIEYAGVDLRESGEESNKKVKFKKFNELVEDNKVYFQDFDTEDGELLFQHLYRPAMRERIENEFGIKLNEMPFHYHVNFLRFLSEKNIEEANKVKEFLGQTDNKDGKNNRIKSFLSLEQGGEEMGDKILEIGEELGQESADLVFAKYSEIVDLGKKNTEEFSELLKSKKDLSLEEKEMIARSFTKKGTDLLIKFSNKIKELKGKEKKLYKEEVLRELEQYKTDLILTASVYKSLKESGEDISLEDFKGVIFEQATAAQINESKGDMAQMMDIYKRNYEDKPELQKKLLEGFSEKLKTGGNKVAVYLYKKDGEIIAFNRFDDNGKEGKYFASCNVRPEIAGSSIGGALIKATLEKETSNNELVKGDCLPESSVSSHYIEKMGFAVRGIVKNYEGTPETVFNIERSAENQNYYYRSYETSEIIAEHENKFQDNSHKEEERMILKFKKNSPELFKASEELMNKKGYVMTRYIFSSDGEYIYCAFESGGKSLKE